MLVSVVIPVYNEEKYIRQCLDSVISQSMDDSLYEIIVYNDGSTDGTEEILKEYKKHCILVTESRNHGVAYAINEAIALSSGDYIRILGADDEMLPTALESLMWHVEAIEDADNKIFYTNYHIIRADGTLKKSFMEPETHDDLFAKEGDVKGDSNIDFTRLKPKPLPG